MKSCSLIWPLCLTPTLKLWWMLPSTLRTRGNQHLRVASARRRCRLVGQASRGSVANHLLGRRPHLRGLTRLGRAQITLTVAIQRHALEVLVMHLLLLLQAAQLAEVLDVSYVANQAILPVNVKARSTQLRAPMCPSPM